MVDLNLYNCNLKRSCYDRCMRDLEMLIESAGSASEMPAFPAGGIPPQRLPGWIRWSVRGILYPFILLDLSMQAVARFCIRPPFKKEGKCLKRGNCCHYILLPKAKGFLNRVNLFWNTEVHGFYFRDTKEYESEGKPVYLMGCRYLKADGSCAHYRLRPVVCRKWPLIEMFGFPRLLKGCGFKAVPRKKSFGSRDFFVMDGEKVRDGDGNCNSDHSV